MSVEKPELVDFISTTPEGKVSLTISDHLTSDEINHLQLLQDKINDYLSFIESGQIYENYPDAINRDIAICTVTKFEPSTEGVDFLERCREIVSSAGMGLNGVVWLINRLASISMSLTTPSM